ncbi:MAG: (d)CMP kinase [Kiritimatiellia bacterium]
MSPEPTIITIDGPSASGKSTVGAGVARRLGYVFVESGSLYRGVTWKALEEGIEEKDEKALENLLAALDVEFFQTADTRIGFRINGVEPGKELRGNDVDRSVSRVSAVAAVRKWVVDRLLGLTAFGDLVMEGRDIGSAVFPEADYKFFLNASPCQRAKRRRADMLSTGSGAQLDSVLKSLERRDRIDSSRSMDPLRVPEGAVVIDSTSMRAEEVIDLIVAKVAGRS